jgi:hypothetical protein
MRENPYVFTRRFATYNRAYLRPFDTDDSKAFELYCGALFSHNWHSGANENVGTSYLSILEIRKETP